MQYRGPDAGGCTSLLVGCYRLHFEVIDPLVVQDFLGSQLRGAFGPALKRAVCVLPEHPECATCPKRRGCPYPWFFEDIGATLEVEARHHAPPRPFIIGPDVSEGFLPPGAVLGMNLTLIGWANEVLPFVLNAWQEAGRRGLGPRRARLLLREVLQQDPQRDGRLRRIDASDGSLHPLVPKPLRAPPAAPKVRLVLITPLHLKRDGHLVREGQFRFADLHQNLVKRRELLQYFYGAAKGSLQAEAAEAIPDPVIEGRLYWRDWTRWSNRQGTRMKFGGLMGHLVLDGALLGSRWEELWLGQFLHAGNETSFGLGRYVLLPAY